MTCRSSTVNMVDCGNLRCYQERRLIKKELMTWSKKIPLAVGLETIAEHVGSRRKVRKLFEPFNCLEQKTPQDWEPEENCFYCKDRIQLLFDAIEKSDSKEGGKILKDHPSLRHLGEVLPFLPQFYTSDFGRDILSDIKSATNEPEPAQPVARDPSPKPSIELIVPSVANSPTGKTKKDSSTVGKKGYSTDDLAAAASEVKNGKLGTRRAANLYGVPRSTIRHKVFKMENEDLTDSPTLSHNDDSSDLPLFSAPNMAATHFSPPSLNTQDRPLMLTDLLHLSQLQYLAPIAIPYFINTEMLMMPYGEESEYERRLQNIRHKHNLARVSMNQYKTKALANHKLRPFQYDVMKKLTKERLQQELKTAKSTRRDKESRKSSHDTSRSESRSEMGFLPRGLSPMMSRDFSPSPSPAKRIKKEVAETSTLSAAPALNPNALMQSVLYKALNVNHPFLTALNMNDSSSDSDITLSDLSYLPSAQKENNGFSPSDDAQRKIYDSLFKYENTRIGDTLKDIIVKTISEKVKCKLESADFSDLVGAGSSQDSQKAKKTIMSAFSVPEASRSSPAKRSKRESHAVHDTPKSPISHSQNGTPVKKTRPKRGQYRKYNSQLLTEAVKAVQRGEMSVHRAGSYYGVPHSTLEYKVKERHLLRQKKIKEQQELKQKQEEEQATGRQKNEKEKDQNSSSDDSVAHPTSETSSSKSSSKSSSTPRSSTPSSSWLPPFQGSMPYDSAATMGMFGTGFALNTPASELLRKLQHKVQSKSESGDDSPGPSTYPTSTEGYVYIQ